MVTYDTVCFYRAEISGDYHGGKLGISVNSDIKEESIASFPCIINSYWIYRDAMTAWAGKAPAYNEMTELSGVAASVEPGSQITINKRQFVAFQAYDPDIQIKYRYSDTPVDTGEPTQSGKWYEDTESKITLTVDEDSLVIVWYQALPDPNNNDKTNIIRIKVNEGVTNTYSQMYLPRNGEESWHGLPYFFEAAPGTYEIQGVFNLNTTGYYHSIKKRNLVAVAIPLDYNFDYIYANNVVTRTSSSASIYSAGCYNYGVDDDCVVLNTNVTLPSDATMIIIGHFRPYLSESNNCYDYYRVKNFLEIDGTRYSVVANYTANHRTYLNDSSYLLYATDLDAGTHNIKFGLDYANFHCSCGGWATRNYRIVSTQESYCVLFLYKS